MFYNIEKPKTWYGKLAQAIGLSIFFSILYAVDCWRRFKDWLINQ